MTPGETHSPETIPRVLYPYILCATTFTWFSHGMYGRPSNSVTWTNTIKVSKGNNNQTPTQKWHKKALTSDAWTGSGASQLAGLCAQCFVCFGDGFHGRSWTAHEKEQKGEWNKWQSNANVKMTQGNTHQWPLEDFPCALSVAVLHCHGECPWDWIASSTSSFSSKSTWIIVRIILNPPATGTN